MAELTVGTGAAARRRFAWLLLAAAAGAGLVLIGVRQSVARVVIAVPRPLPAAVVTLRFTDLQPAIAALAVAVLASLAAVLATRRLLRRMVAVLTAVLGAAIMPLAIAGVSRAGALAAAARAATPAGTGAGSGPGSVTAGVGAASPGEPVTGLPAGVVLEGAGWHWLIAAGALLVVAMAILIAIRAYRLPAMSARYGPAPGAPSATRAAAAAVPRAQTMATGPAAPRRGRTADYGVAAWEALSAGADPTMWPSSEPAGDLGAVPPD